MRFLMLLFVLSICLIANTPAQRDIKLQLLWTHQFEFAGFYMAKEKGYYKEVGFNVEIIDGFMKNTIEDVDSGKVHFGVAGSKIVYEAIKGKKLVALASIFQNSPFAWVVRKDSNITTLHDFVGKKVMHPVHSLDNIELLSIIKARGVDSSKINFIPTSYNIQDLIDKKCDVFSAYVSNEPYELEKAGLEYRLFQPVEYGVDFYGDILFTSQNYLDKNPKVVKKFREASLKGWEYAFEHMEETINLIHNKYNPSLSLGHLRYEANILKKQSLYPFVAVGTMDRNRWIQIAHTFKDLQYLDSAVLPKNFMYDENKDKTRDMILKWVGVTVLLFIILVFIATILIRKHNKYLHKLVDERTREIEAQKRNYETLFSKSMDAILIIQEGRFLKANNVFMKMFGYEKYEEMLNLQPSDFSPKYQPDGELSETKAKAMIEVCLATGSNNFEWVHQKKDGETFWCDVSLSKVMFDDKESVQGVIRNISRQKALEEHLEREVKIRTQKLEIAMRAKSDFLANMSHEIRTPLNAIIGFVDILYKNEDKSEKKKKLKIIKESGYSLLTIINDILDFSKIENNKLLVEKVPFNISETFGNIVELFFDKAQEYRIKINLHVDEQLPQFTLGDSVRVKQVFSNFLSNAIKFSDEDSTIDVTVKYGKNRDELYCEVKDFGIGIAKDKLDSIFNAFVQEDSSTTRKYGGTGLGLSISKALVNLMGGEVGVSSELNIGSCFYFTIPLFETEQSIKEIEQEEAGEGLLQGKVLVVEDNKSNQLLMTLLLDELGLSSVVANDGSQAVQMMKENDDFDLILMDENMPVMNGIEATREIRLLQNCRNIPIIAVSANALKGDKERFLAAKLDDYISKPIDANKLVSVLRKYL